MTHGGAVCVVVSLSGAICYRFLFFSGPSVVKFVLKELQPRRHGAHGEDYERGSRCPPNFFRMADKIFSAKVCSCRERNRVYSAALSTSAGTASSIAA